MASTVAGCGGGQGRADARDSTRMPISPRRPHGAAIRLERGSTILPASLRRAPHRALRPAVFR